MKIKKFGIDIHVLEYETNAKIWKMRIIAFFIALKCIRIQRFIPAINTPRKPILGKPFYRLVIPFVKMSKMKEEPAEEVDLL